jgi:hypothetical protein
MILTAHAGIRPTHGTCVTWKIDGRTRHCGLSLNGTSLGNQAAARSGEGVFRPCKRTTGEMIKGLPQRDERPCADAVINTLHRAKWHLWHGCPYPALSRLESLGWELDANFSPEEARLLARLEEFIGCLENNQNFIVNYGARYGHCDPITSRFVESAVNQVVSKRFVKRQQMAWRPALAHGLLRYSEDQFLSVHSAEQPARHE